VPKSELAEQSSSHQADCFRCKRSLRPVRSVIGDGISLITAVSLSPRLPTARLSCWLTPKDGKRVLPVAGKDGASLFSVSIGPGVRLPVFCEREVKRPVTKDNIGIPLALTKDAGASSGTLVLLFRLNTQFALVMSALAAGSTAMVIT
jgi:hypothetical protein